MNSGDHERARHLIARELVEGLTSTEKDWLLRHMDACEACAEEAAETRRAVYSFRMESVPVPPDLAVRTQVRVYLRSEQLQAGRCTGLLLSLACLVSWGLGAATVPYVWRACEWLGRWAGLADPVWQAGVVLWWAVPALLAVAVAFWQQRGSAARSEWDGGVR